MSPACVGASLPSHRPPSPSTVSASLTPPSFLSFDRLSSQRSLLLCGHWTSLRFTTRPLGGAKFPQSLPLLVSQLSPSDPRSSSRFAALTSLHVSLFSAEVDLGWLAAVFPSRAAFPHLSDLEVNTQSPPRSFGPSTLPLSAIACLEQLPSLRALRLHKALNEQHLAVLLALPLEHLDLSRCRVNDVAEGVQSDSALTGDDVELTWRSARMPTLIGAQPHCSALLDRALQRYAGTEKSQLSLIHCSQHVTEATALSLAHISSLIGLHAEFGAAEHLTPFFTTLGPSDTPLLPRLQRLSVAMFQLLSSLRGRGDTSVYVQFFRRYGQQLHVVDFSGGPRQLGMWVNDEGADALSAVLLALFSEAKHLRFLRLTGDWRGAVLVQLPSPLAPFPHIHTLRLEWLNLREPDLFSLLMLCPLLEDCTLKLDCVQLLELLALGTRCPHLRRLWLERLFKRNPPELDGLIIDTLLNTHQGALTVSEYIVEQIWQQGSLAGTPLPEPPHFNPDDPTPHCWFPSLSVAVLLTASQLSTGDSTFAMLAALPVILQDAPLRRLHIETNAPCQAAVPLLASLSQLRSLSGCDLSDEDLQPYSEPRVVKVQARAASRVLLREAVLSEAEMEAEETWDWQMSQWFPLEFVQTHSFDGGRDGREAFFADWTERGENDGGAQGEPLPEEDAHSDSTLS